jgi:hypothetical protein
MNATMKLFCTVVAAALLEFPLPASAQTDFKVCESTYALCTTAQCKPGESSDELSCDCEVRKGLSVGLESCKPEEKVDQGTEIRSRYFPVESYAICSNDRPWAWCLDKVCVIDPEDPQRATCACTVAEDQGPYVIVTATYTEVTCQTGIISSATVQQIDEVTQFLEKSSKLKPFDIKILNPEGR